jgi:hypothetical protein
MAWVQALARMMQPFMSWATRRYQTVLAERLKDYGLRYDDLYDPIMDMVGASATGPKEPHPPPTVPILPAVSAPWWGLWRSESLHRQRGRNAAGVVQPEHGSRRSSRSRCHTVAGSIPHYSIRLQPCVNHNGLAEAKAGQSADVFSPPKHTPIGWDTC